MYVILSKSQKAESFLLYFQQQAIQILSRHNVFFISDGHFVKPHYPVPPVTFDLHLRPRVYSSPQLHPHISLSSDDRIPLPLTQSSLQRKSI